MPNTKIHPSNIDMDLLSEELAKSYEFNRGQKNDVSHVAGVSSELIAKAATRTIGGNDTLVSDRNTVEKALYIYNALDNEKIPASSIATNTKVMDYTDSVYEKRDIVTNRRIADDISSLREEVYALVNSLSRKGILKKYYPNNGFIDPFTNLDPRYDVQDVCPIVQTGAISAGFTQHIYITKSNANKLKAGMWYIVEKEFTNTDKLYELIYISAITESAENDLIDCTVLDYDMSDVGLNLKDSFDLYTELPTMNIKYIHGQYINNTFSFSETDTYVSTGKVNEISFDDDSLTINVPGIDNENNPAYAFSFRVPANKIGALKTLTIYGNAGDDASDLRCYILKDKDRAEEDPLSLDERFNMNDSTIIGVSKQIFVSTLEDSSWNVNSKLVFDFASEDDGKYKIALENDTYILVITKTNPEAYGSWTFLCSRNPSTNNDVQTYNKSYTYHKNDDGLYVFDEKEYNYDLIYSIITEENLNEKEIGFTKGLYTSDTFYFDKCTDIELSLVINREGLFRVATTATINGSNNDPIVTELDTSVDSLNTTTLGYNYGIKAGDTVVIGDNILTIKKENSDNRLFVQEDNVQVQAGDKVYKVGYKPIMIVDFGEESFHNYYAIPMELVKVIPNNERTINSMSDKLIYKPKDDSIFCKIEDTEDSISINNSRYDAYNAKIAIAWQSNVPEQYFAEGEYSNSNFIGRIYSAVVSSSSVLGGIDSLQ